MRNLLEVLHYVRMQHILMASAMTATTGIVLVGKIHWQPIMVVFLGTYFVYSIDNLIDWVGENHLLPVVQSIWNCYLIKCLFLLPLSLIFGLVLIKEHWYLILFLSFAGFFSLGQVIATKQMVSQEKGLLILWFERIADALMWSLITTLVPVIYEYDKIKTTPQVFMVIAFNLFITLTIVMVWDATRAATNGLYHGSTVLSDIYGVTTVISKLMLLNILAIGLATIDIVFGYFPIYNFVVLLVPILYLFLLSLYNMFRHLPLIYVAMFSIASLISCLSIIVVYYVAM